MPSEGLDAFVLLTQRYMCLLRRWISASTSMHTLFLVRGCRRSFIWNPLKTKRDLIGTHILWILPLWWRGALRVCDVGRGDCVKERRVLTTGYNGAPTGLAHCADAGCVRDRLKIPSGERHELCRGLHAEQNAIIQAAVYGVSIRGGTLYSTDYPCSVCAKMIVNAGIKRVVYQGSYPDDLAKAILAEAGVKVVRLGGDTGAGKGNPAAEARPT